MSSRLYISNLPSDIKVREIEDKFSEFGRILFSDIKGSSGYLEFELSKDATKAVENLDGESFKGKKISVEFAKKSNNNSSSYRSKEKPNRARSQDKCYLCQDYGHWAANCPKGDGVGVSGGKCFKCNEKGHIARKCPNSRRKYSRSRSRSSRSSRSRSRSRGDSRKRRNSGRNHQRRKDSSRSYSSKSRSKSSPPRRKKSRSSRKYSISRSVSKSMSYSLSKSKSRSKS